LAGDHLIDGARIDAHGRKHLAGLVMFFKRVLLKFGNGMPAIVTKIVTIGVWREKSEKIIY